MFVCLQAFFFSLFFFLAGSSDAKWILEEDLPELKERRTMVEIDECLGALPLTLWHQAEAEADRCDRQHPSPSQLESRSLV